MARLWRWALAASPAAGLRFAAWVVLALWGATAHAQDAQGVAVAPAAASAPPYVVAGLWAHEVVNRPADPAVRFGKLPNGMRYALQFHGTVQTGVAFRLRIGSGSVHERDDERGAAHFLEHMAFRGSTRLKDGDMVHLLQRQGLAFGQDTNAFTTHEQTLYHFNFPKSDAAVVDAGLLITREIADQLRIDPAVVDQERGVVLAEERAGAAPLMLVQKALLTQLLNGTRAADRWPLADADAIARLGVAELRRYYDAHYRPGNATLVVVGYFDVDDVERRIRESFSTWAASAAPEGPHEVPSFSGAVPIEVLGDGLPETISLTWRLPPDLAWPTEEADRARWVDQIAVRVLNNRLADRIAQADSALVFGGALHSLQVFRQVGFLRLVLLPKPGRWQDALGQAVIEVRQLLSEGVGAADLARVLPDMKRELQAALGAQLSRNAYGLADGIVMSDGAGQVHVNAWQVQKWALPVLDAQTPESVSKALRGLMGGGLPLLATSAPVERVSLSALSQSLAQDWGRSVAARAVESVADWPYGDFGRPGEIQSRVQDPAWGATLVRFANGTRLFVKPTFFDRARIQVQVSLGQGRSGMTDAQSRLIWALDDFPQGGTVGFSAQQLEQWRQRSGRQLSVAFRQDVHGFVLSGTTTAADLLPQLQVLAGYARHPGFRPEWLQKLKTAVPVMVGLIEGTAVGPYAREMRRVMNGGEPRLAEAEFPAAQTLEALSVDDFASVLREPLAGTPDVVIVGDVTVADAIEAVRATFGAGPVRPRPPFVKLKIAPPAPGGYPHEVSHGGREDQALIGWHWTLPDRWADLQLATTATVAAAVLQARLQDGLRSQFGLTYAPEAASWASWEVIDQGGFSVQMQMPAEHFATFRQVLRAQLYTLAEWPISADELDRARQPLLEGQRKAPNSNGHWLFWMSLALRDARATDGMKQASALLEAVDAAKVQAFFKDRVASRPPIEVVSRAARSASADSTGAASPGAGTKTRGD